MWKIFLFRVRSFATVDTAAKQGSRWQRCSGAQADGACFKLLFLHICRLSRRLSHPAYSTPLGSTHRLPRPAALLTQPLVLTLPVPLCHFTSLPDARPVPSCSLLVPSLLTCRHSRPDLSAACFVLPADYSTMPCPTPSFLTHLELPWIPSSGPARPPLVPSHP